MRLAASVAPSTSASMWRPGRRTSSAATTRSPSTVSQPSSSHASGRPRPGRSMPYHASAAGDYDPHGITAVTVNVPSRPGRKG